MAPRIFLFVWSVFLILKPSAFSGSITGSVKDSAGKTRNGVFVSAHRDGATYTVTVYSDDSGRFRFPELARGSYTITAHAGGFQPDQRSNFTVQDGQIPLDFTLAAETRPEELLQQATAAEWLTSLPGTLRQKNSLTKNCGSCHHNILHLRDRRFTKEDWIKLISVMERIDVIGEIRDYNPRPPYYLPWRYGNKEEIAEYLAQVQGPNSPLPKIQFSPRATGKATQAVITEYRVPRPNAIPHDVQLDSHGIAWYNDFKTDYLGRIDPKTGEIKEYKLPSKTGPHPGSANMFIGDDDTIWVSQRIAGQMVRFDPKSEKVIGIWQGVNFDRFDSKKGVAYGTNIQMDVNTGKVLRYKYKASTDGYGTAVDSRGYAYRGGIADSDIKVLNPETGEVINYRTPTPDSGPRRITLDGDDYLWFGEWFGEKIGMLDIKAGKLSEFPVSDSFATFYEAGVDPKNHIGWAYDWRNDRLDRVNPKTGEVTEYPMPTLDVESRRTAVDDSTNPPTVWIHGAGNGLIIRVQAP